MGNAIAMIVYLVVIVIFYAVILFQKSENRRMQINVKNLDWIFFASMTMGGVVFAQTIMDTDVNLPSGYMLLGLAAFLLVSLVYTMVRKRKTGKPMVKMMSDERVNQLSIKSARNALFVTYLVLLLQSFLSDTAGLDTTWMLIMLGSGLLVLIASYYYYYYKQS
jgi:uncharacterized membrane protein